MMEDEDNYYGWEDLPEYNIEQDAFRQWLTGLPNWAEVGVTGQPKDCPLRHFLKRHTGAEAKVYPYKILDASGKALGRTPDWAQDFISNIDSKFFSPSVVRAAKALEYL